MVFEVENVLLHTPEVKRNAGEGTPAKYLPFFFCKKIRYYELWYIKALRGKVFGR